jgi:hypothetical protein
VIEISWELNHTLSSPYFAAPTASAYLLKSNIYEFESTQINEKDSENESDKQEVEESSSSEDSDLDAVKLEDVITSSNFSNFTDLTGQPSFF